MARAIVTAISIIGIEHPREQALAFWNQVIYGISKEVDAARKSEASNVIQLYPDWI